MGNTPNDKKEALKFNYDDFSPSSEENSNPLSSFILKNTNKERPLIGESKLFEEMFNGSIADVHLRVDKIMTMI